MAPAYSALPNNLAVVHNLHRPPFRGEDSSLGVDAGQVAHGGGQVFRAVRLSAAFGPLVAGTLMAPFHPPPPRATVNDGPSDRGRRSCCEPGNSPVR